jgi:hypothetical protein
MPKKERISSLSEAESMECSRNKITQLGDAFYELMDETKKLVGRIKYLEARVGSLEKEISQMKNNKGHKEQKTSKKSNNPIPRTVSIREYIGINSSASMKKKTKKNDSKTKPVAKEQPAKKKEKISKSKEEGSGKRSNYRGIQRQHRRHLMRFLQEESLKKSGTRILLHPNSTKKLLLSEHDTNTSGEFEQQAQTWRKEFSRLYVLYRSAVRRLVTSRTTKIAPTDDLMKTSFEEKVTPLISKALHRLGERVNGDSWKDIIESVKWEVGTREPITKKDFSNKFIDIYEPAKSDIWPYTAEKTDDSDGDLTNFLEKEKDQYGATDD